LSDTDDLAAADSAANALPRRSSLRRGSLRPVLSPEGPAAPSGPDKHGAGQ